MTASVELEAEIRRLYFAEHWKRGTIAAQLGVHPDVVVRVLGSFGPRPAMPRPAARVLESYVGFVDVGPPVRHRDGPAPARWQTPWRSSREVPTTTRSGPRG